MAQQAETKERQVFHVTFDENKQQWKVLKENQKQPQSLHTTKDAAIESAKKLAKASGLGQVIIHKENHVIETEYTYGNDPRDVPG
jgi:hypothetical protein